MWNKEIVSERAETLLLAQRVTEILEERGQILTRFLGEGQTGQEVRLLQEQLAQAGFFPWAEVNGNFGPLTADAVLQYQLARGIIANASNTGAGYVGPSTLNALRQDKQKQAYNIVRSQGLSTL